jgi:hypothetical protein
MKSNLIIIVVKTILTQVKVRVYNLSLYYLMCSKDLQLGCSKLSLKDITAKKHIFSILNLVECI